MASSDISMTSIDRKMRSVKIPKKRPAAAERQKKYGTIGGNAKRVSSKRRTRNATDQEAGMHEFAADSNALDSIMGGGGIGFTTEGDLVAQSAKNMAQRKPWGARAADKRRQTCAGRASKQQVRCGWECVSKELCTEVLLHCRGQD